VVFTANCETPLVLFNHGQKFGLIPRGDEYNPMKLVSAPCKIELRSGAVERGGSGGAD
jgi:hypothetical protein